MRRINRVTEDDFIKLAAEGKKKELKLKLNLGENVDRMDSMQRTALMEAVRNGHK